jgi:SufS family cysteine desulfurase
MNADIRGQFPALQQTVNGRPLAYLDSAATTMRPERVLRVMDDYYRYDNANVHRGSHALARRSTEAFDAARETVRQFVNAPSFGSIVFTKGCTESINLAANAWGRANLKPGDVILLSSMEHHANVVPWQFVAEATGAKLRSFDLTPCGQVNLEDLKAKLTPEVRIVGVKHVCNALGTINPIAEIARLARANGSRIIVDGAQGLGHQKVDVQALGIDFYAMSAHKVYGPMGVGALAIGDDALAEMGLWQGGGDMTRVVSIEKSTFHSSPRCFEPGTPNVAGVLGFAEALRFVQEIGLGAIDTYEQELLALLTAGVESVPGISILGRAPHKAPVVSFSAPMLDLDEAGAQFDEFGVAVRCGRHCCMPLMESCGLEGTIRASCAVYTNKEDINVMIEALQALAAQPA